MSGQDMEGTQARRRADSRTAVAGLAVGLAVVAAALLAGPLAGAAPPTVPLRPPWWALAALFALAEVAVVHLEVRREAHSFSLSEIPLVVGLLTVAPLHLVTARVVGSGVALCLHRRQGPLKLLFNLANLALEAAVAALVLAAVGVSGPPVAPGTWLGVFLATAMTAVVGGTAVAGVIRLRSRTPSPGLLGKVVGAQVTVTAVNTALGLVAAVVLWTAPAALLLLAVVGAALLLAYRGYTDLRQRHGSLEVVQRFSRAVGPEVRPDAVVRAILEELREVLRAEVVEVVAQDEAWRLDGGDTCLPVPVGQSLAAALGHRAGERLLYPRVSREPAGRHALAAAGVADAVVVPLPGERGASGSITVADRMGDVATFGPDDLAILDTLAGSIALTLDRGRLVGRLQREAADKEFRALHDPVTGLPNRIAFHELVDAALATTPPPSASPAVLLMDLDRFKEVNDTLGHDTGDELLVEVGRRILGVLRSGDGVARLGGDEFGILLPAVHSVQGAVATAEAVRVALEQPFRLGGMTLTMGASIGVALPGPEQRSRHVIRNAEVAMYQAKDGHLGIHTYDAAHDSSHADRLALVSELRNAIADDTLTVFYQPKLDLRTGMVTGAEALLRWQHPERGFIPPDEFIPVAESTGLIGPLTVWVLRASLRQQAQWLAAGLRLSVAVNLSARSLSDAALPATVRDLLRETGVPPELLTLELTESTVMGDPERASGVLLALRELGVRLAIDDFGTGYSSLAYLARLPVDEMKIDRSFVMSYATNTSDAVIVQSTLDMGARLALEVVAEGVEDGDTLESLRRLRCTYAQGYHISRPLPAAELEDWLRARQPVPTPAGTAGGQPSAAEGTASGEAARTNVVALGPRLQA